MAINTLSQPMALTGSGINSLLALPNPENGLTIGQVIDVIKSSGRDALVINCADLPPGAFVSALAAIVRSGHAALVVFTTQGDEEHVVLVFGHTRNSDQWHPLAIPAYSGHISAHFIPSSQWVSHFLIHDDNFGPYYTLSSRALDLSASVKAHWIVGILADAPNILPQAAETAAAVILANNLTSFSTLTGTKWFKYITSPGRELILRTTLLSRNDYLDHLVSSRGHDESSCGSTQTGWIGRLPDLLWMVEYTLPPLYTGNRSKLGEVVIDAKASLDGGIYGMLKAIRLPGYVVIVSALGNETRIEPFDLNSHSPIYRVRSHENEW